MAPAQNDSFDFFMAETTCSEAQSDTEDSNLDSLLQKFKSPSAQEPQQCLSDICNVSDSAEGSDIMCDQSSSQLTMEDNVMVTSVSGGGCDMSPSHSSVYISHTSPLSVSTASVAATAGTHCDLTWPSMTDDESVSEVCTSPKKGEKRKASPGASPCPRRQAIPHYQTMTPWTNDNLNTQGSFPSPSQEIPCFPLDAQSVRDPGMNAASHCKTSPTSKSRLQSVAVTETVYSLTSSSANLSIPGGHSSGQSLKRPATTQVTKQTTREKRFRKTAEALQKCGLWDIAMKTGNLIKQNAELQKEIDRFRTEATLFLKAVVQNPENKELMESLSRGVPSTLGHKMRASKGFESECAVTTIVCTTNSDCNSSTTSGYASYTEGRSKQTSPT
ncbi:hypothetical protein ACOMHN_032974 [Nucella lapillus]